MDRIKNSSLFRVISLVLIITFIALDISYAYPPEHNASDSTLAIPSALQQAPVTEHAARFQQSAFSQGALLASIYDIAEYCFGNAEKGIGPLPLKHADEAIRVDLRKHLDDAGTEILGIVPVEEIKTRTAPEKLRSALDEIGFKGTLPDEGVVFILYKKGGKRFLVQVARKDQISPDSLPGYEWVVSDKYVVKYIPEDYEEPAKEKANAVLTLPERAFVNQQGQEVMDFLAARESYDVRSGLWTSVSDENALIESGPYDVMLVLGSADERVPKEAVVIAKKLHEQNPGMVIVTSGKWGDHVGASGRYIDKDGKRITEAGHFKNIMEALGASVDIVEDRSTNSGQNIQFSRDKLRENNLTPAKILVIQIPELQLRAGRSLVQQYPKEGETLDSLGVQIVTNYSPYIPDISSMSDEQALSRVQVAISEIQRLPSYSGIFMVPTEIPPAIVEAEKALKTIVAAKMELHEKEAPKAIITEPIAQIEAPSSEGEQPAGSTENIFSIKAITAPMLAAILMFPQIASAATSDNSGVFSSYSLFAIACLTIYLIWVYYKSRVKKSMLTRIVDRAKKFGFEKFRLMHNPNTMLLESSFEFDRKAALDINMALIRPIKFFLLRNYNSALLDEIIEIYLYQASVAHTDKNLNIVTWAKSHGYDSLETVPDGIYYSEINRRVYSKVGVRGAALFIWAGLWLQNREYFIWGKNAQTLKEYARRFLDQNFLQLIEPEAKDKLSEADQEKIIEEVFKIDAEFRGVYSPSDSNRLIRLHSVNPLAALLMLALLLNGGCINSFGYEGFFGLVKIIIIEHPLLAISFSVIVIAWISEILSTQENRTVGSIIASAVVGGMLGVFVFSPLIVIGLAAILGFESPYILLYMIVYCFLLNPVMHIFAWLLNKIDNYSLEDTWLLKYLKARTNSKLLSFIIEEIINYTTNKEEISIPRIFIFVQSKIPESMQGLRSALVELKPLSEQDSVTTNGILVAIAQAKEKYSLSDKETRILWLALTGKSKDDNTSTNLMSVNPFASILGVAVLGSIFSAFKDFAFAHPIIAIIATLAIEAAEFLIIWRVFYPVSWYLWCLKSNFTSLRTYAAKTLIKRKDPRSVEPLIKALTHNNPKVRILAAYILGDLRDSRAAEALIKALADDNPDVRQMAARALVKIKDPIVIELLKKELNNNYSKIRLYAAMVLGSIKDPRALDALIEASGSDDSTRRLYIAQVLGEMKDPRVKEVLIKALDDIDSKVRLHAAEALDKIGWKPGTEGEKILYFIAQRRFDPLINIGSPTVSYLIKALGDSDYKVRMLGAYVLGEIKAAKGTEPLIQALADTNSDVRQMAAKAVEKIGEPRISFMAGYLGTMSEKSSGYYAALSLEEAAYIANCLRRGIHVEVTYIPYSVHVKKGSIDSHGYRPDRTIVDSPARLVIKMDNSRQSDSITLKSINPIAAMLGVTILVSLLSAVGYLAFAHSIIAGVATLGISIAAFFIIWRAFFPISWYLWRLNNSRNEHARVYFAEKLSPLNNSEADNILINRMLEALTLDHADFVALSINGKKRFIDNIIERLNNATDPDEIHRLGSMLREAENVREKRSELVLKIEDYASRLWLVKSQEIDKKARDHIYYSKYIPEIVEPILTIAEDFETARKMLASAIRLFDRTAHFTYMTYEDRYERDEVDRLKGRAGTYVETDPITKTSEGFTFDLSKATQFIDNIVLSAIISSVTRRLKRSKEMSPQALFVVAQSKVPITMVNLSGALKELEPLSLQVNLSAHVISQAIAQAKEKYSLSDEETKILQLAFLGPGQGSGSDQNKETDHGIIAAESPAQITSKISEAIESRGTVLVTGGAGYIGSHTVRKLLKDRYDVVVLDNLVKGRRFAIERNKNLADSLGRRFIFEEGDLGDKGFVKNVFDRNKIDSVIHFAAFIEVSESMQRPALYFYNNIVNTTYLLDAMALSGVKRIIFSSSAATYGQPEKMPISEDTPTNPINPYGYTKLAMEELIEHYHNTFGIDWIALRYFNASGASLDGELGESHFPESHLIPLTIDRLSRGLKMRAFGTDYETRDGSNLRDYISVEDLASAHVMALESAQGALNRPYNLGSGNGFTVLEIIEKTGQILGVRAEWEDVGRRPGDPDSLLASSEAFERAVGWKPENSGIESIITSAVNWHNARPAEATELKPLPEISEEDAAKKVTKEISENRIIPPYLQDEILTRLERDRKGENQASQLFEIIESSVANHRSEFIEAGNKLIRGLDKNMATAEIRQKVEKAMAAIGSSDKESVAPETRAAVELLKKNLNQFEADGAVGSLIVLARRAKRENQKLIIGLETDWIPGITVENSLQRQAITTLMKEIDSIAEALQSMGLDNVEVIHGSGDELAGALLSRADDTHTSLHNVVVMASANTINSDSFADLRDADEGDKPFLAGIDPKDLIKLYEQFGESLSKQLYIKLTALLYMTLEIASGKEPPKVSWITYDSVARILLLTPGAEIMDYEKLKDAYKGDLKALQAA